MKRFLMFALAGVSAVILAGCCCKSECPKAKECPKAVKACPKAEAKCPKAAKVCPKAVK